MKDLIITALNEAIETLEQKTPQTKLESVYVNIGDVNPLDLGSFIAENNIPKDAWFSTEQEDGLFSHIEPVLRYNTVIPTTNEERLKYKKDKFSTIAFPIVFKHITNNGYKRKGFNSGLLRQFEDTTVYDMYINKDFDRLVEYYSLYFSFNAEN